MDNLSNSEAAKYLKRFDKEVKAIELTLKRSNFGVKTAKNKGIGRELEEFAVSLKTNDLITAKTALFNFLGRCQLKKLTIPQISEISGIPVELLKGYLTDYRDWRAGVQGDQMRALEEFDQAVMSIDNSVALLSDIQDMASEIIYKTSEKIVSISSIDLAILSRAITASKMISDLQVHKQELYTRQGLNHNLRTHFNKGTKSKHESQAEEFVKIAVGAASSFNDSDLKLLNQRVNEARGTEYFQDFDKFIDEDEMDMD